MDMGVIGQVATPGVENPDHAQITTQKARVLRQLLCGRGRSAKEQIVEQPLLAARQGAQLGREGKGEHEVRGGQQQRLLPGQPVGRFVPLTLRAVTIAARMIIVLRLFTAIAGVDVTAQHGCATLHDSMHNLAVTGQKLVAKLGTVSRAILPEDVGQRYHGASVGKPGKSAIT